MSEYINPYDMSSSGYTGDNLSDAFVKMRVVFDDLVDCLNKEIRSTRIQVLGQKMYTTLENLLLDMAKTCWTNKEGNATDIESLHDKKMVTFNHISYGKVDEFINCLKNLYRNKTIEEGTWKGEILANIENLEREWNAIWFSTSSSDTGMRNMKLSDIPEVDEGIEEDDENDSSYHKEDEEDENNRSEDTGSEVDSTGKLKKEIQGNSADDGWITHDANEYIVVHAWQGQMRNTYIDKSFYEFEFRYYLKDHSVWFIQNGSKYTDNVTAFPDDAYKTAGKRWEESLANYVVIEQKIKFVNYTDNALIEELREYAVDGSRQLYYFDGRVWIHKKTLPKSTTEESKTEGANAVHKRPALWKRVVNSLGGNRNNTKRLLMDLEALGKSID
jgi:hypothetical protein